jgi:hypothetical protein
MSSNAWAMKPGDDQERHMAIEIEKNIPIPPAHTAGITDTARRLEVGDSFLLKGRTIFSSGQMVALRQATGMNFVRRKVEGGIRIWRIE